MTSGPDVPANLQEARTLLEEAARRGAQVAALPENFAFIGLSDGDKRAHRRRGRPRTRAGFSRGRAPDGLECGSWAVRCRCAARPMGASPPRPWSMTPRGSAAPATTRSTCSTSRYPERAESYRESANVAPGSTAVVVDTPVGRLGLSVCYDVRFPELFRKLSAAGAELLVVPSAFTEPTGRAHWETLLRARAIENLCWVDRAGAVRIPPGRPRDLRRQHDRRSLGPRARSPAARPRLHHRARSISSGSGAIAAASRH